jgi:hypothetical protein
MEEERPGAVPAPSTGDPRVDEAIAGLGRLRDLPLDSQPAVLESVHDKLREILGELGEAGARPGRPGQRGEQGQLPAGAAIPRTPREDG